MAALLPLEGESFFLPALCCSAGLVPLCLVLCRQGKSTLPLLLIFGLLGFLAYCNAAICGPGRLPRSPLAEKAVQGFSAMIDGVGFEKENTRSLLKALLTGNRAPLGAETVEVFRRSGASHILALSGLHLGVIYGILSKALSVLGNSRVMAVLRSLLIVAVAAFYVLMTGASASLIRAFLFICVNEAAAHSTGRRRAPLSTFCIALTLQLSFNPLAIKTVGFQLSYLAMLGILTVYHRMEEWYPGGNRHSPMRTVWKSMALSVACQCFTAPLVWWRFHTFPRYFLLTNLLALPLTELLIVFALFCIGTGALGICPQITKNVCDYLADILLECLGIISSL